MSNLFATLTKSVIVLYGLNPSPSGAADVIVNTSAGTINGVASGGTFNGTKFVTNLSNGVMTFRFLGDFTVASDTNVRAGGSNGAAFMALNNADIGDNVIFDFSASGRVSGAGGGDGGFGGGRGFFQLGALGAAGGSATAGASGGYWARDRYFHYAAGDAQDGRHGSAAVTRYSSALGSDGQSGKTGINGGLGGIRGAATNLFYQDAAGGSPGKGGDAGAFAAYNGAGNYGARHPGGV